MLLSLPDVTLCAVTSVNHELTVRAITKCLQQCSFADVVMVSSQSIEAPFRVDVVPPFTGADYAPFIFKNLARYTTSSFNLLIQYDGYIVEPLAWSDAFLDYDYIGAKWPWHIDDRRVGNSGFCLRSKKLLTLMSEMALPPTGTFVDDKYVCHTMRDYLEREHAIKIAPDAIADRFAYERHTPDQPTFGFHGMFNFWRHNDDIEMTKFINLLDDLYIPTRADAEILFHYHDTRKFQVFQQGYNRLRERFGTPQIKDHLLQFVKDPMFVDALIVSGENLCGLYKAHEAAS